MIVFDLILITFILATAIYMFKESLVRNGFLRLYSFCSGVVCVILTLGLVYPNLIKYLFDKMIQILSYKVW